MRSPTVFACLFSLLILPVVQAIAADKDPGPAVTKSAQSGNWSAAATWQGGKVPAAGARVLILPGHKITYDVAADDVVRAINIAGALSFSRDKDTRLNVGLIKIEDN